MLDTQPTYTLSDFLQNHKEHVARLKETRTPEVLTVQGRAEVVLLDTESYESLIERLEHMEAVSALRTHMAKARKNAPPQEPITETERERRNAILDELVAETERLGLYR